MSNQNNVPTAPGWWYRHLEFGLEPVKVRADSTGRLLYTEAGSTWTLPVHDDGKWAGPVPMPGEWAPRELFDQLWYAAAELSPDPNSRSRIALLKAAIKWTNENLAPEVKP